MDVTPVASPFAQPYYVMAKAAGAACNLACDYCYYSEKVDLYGRSGDCFMSDEVLERFVREYIQSQSVNDVLFVWHGGEPLLRGISFYERVLKLQHKYAAGRHIDNCIQTNGVLINDDWSRFFHDNGILVGVSIDGPIDIHDHYRRDHMHRPTFMRVIRGIDALNRHVVEWNAMAVVNSLNVERPTEFYRFFRDALGCRFLQFAPIVERDHDGHLAAPDSDSGNMTPASITAGQWGDFLITIFDEWVRKDVGEMLVQIFDATLANWAGVTPGVCTLAKVCGHAPVIEHNGDVYSCDHYVWPQYKLGNIMTDGLAGMMMSRKQQSFGLNKFDSLPDKCRQCEYLFACYGECPKNRISVTPSGQPGLNYLCEGYFRYFRHVAPYMEYMKREWQNGRPAAGIMEVADDICLTQETVNKE